MDTAVGSHLVGEEVEQPLEGEEEGHPLVVALAHPAPLHPLHLQLLQLPRPQLLQLLRPPAVPGVAVDRVLGPVPPRPAAGGGLQGLQGALAQSASAHVSQWQRGHVSRVWLPRVVAVSPRLRGPDTDQLRAKLCPPHGGDGVGGAGNKLYVTFMHICFQYSKDDRIDIPIYPCQMNNIDNI